LTVVVPSDIYVCRGCGRRLRELQVMEGAICVCGGCGLRHRIGLDDMGSHERACVRETFYYSVLDEVLS
jgi:hypothetical protein